MPAFFIGTPSRGRPSSTISSFQISLSISLLSFCQINDCDLRDRAGVLSWFCLYHHVADQTVCSGVDADHRDIEQNRPGVPMLVVQRAPANQEVTSQPAIQIIDNADAYGVSQFFDLFCISMGNGLLIFRFFLYLYGKWAVVIRRGWVMRIRK